jgi:hypothetical protein
MASDGDHSIEGPPMSDRHEGEQQESSFPARPFGSFAELSLRELRKLKRGLKKELRRYDVNFRTEHGRWPIKAEKEHIRHLYDRYNALKERIGEKTLVAHSVVIGVHEPNQSHLIVMPPSS